MAAIVAAKLLRAQMLLTISGNRLSVGWYYGSDGDIPPNDGDNIANDIETTVLSAMAAALSEEVKLEALLLNAVAPGVMIPGTNYLSGQIGLISGESLPSNVGAVIQFRQTEVSSRHNGHLVLPGVPEANCVNSLLTESYVSTELQALADALLTPITTSPNTYKLCVVKRRSGGAPITPVGYYVLTAAAVRNMGTQRRRTTELREFHP